MATINNTVILFPRYLIDEEWPVCPIRPFVQLHVLIWPLHNPQSCVSCICTIVQMDLQSTYSSK